MSRMSTDDFSLQYSHVEPVACGDSTELRFDAQRSQLDNVQEGQGDTESLYVCMLLCLFL